MGPYFRFVDRHGVDDTTPWQLQTRTTVDPVREAPGALEQLDSRIAGLAEETDPSRIEQVAAAATYLDRVGSCRPRLMAIVENAGGSGSVTTVIDAITHVALDDLRSGRWDNAQTGLDYGLELCRAKHFRFLEWPLQFGQAMLSAARGDTATTERLASAMIRWAGHTGAHLLRTYAHHALALSPSAGANTRPPMNMRVRDHSARHLPGQCRPRVVAGIRPRRGRRPGEQAGRGARPRACHAGHRHLRIVAATAAGRRRIGGDGSPCAGVLRHSSTWRSRCPKPGDGRSSTRGCS